MSLIRLLNTIIGSYICIVHPETNLFHMGTYHVECRPQNWGKNPPQGKKFWGNVTTFYVAKKKNVVT